MHRLRQLFATIFPLTFVLPSVRADNGHDRCDPQVAPCTGDPEAQTPARETIADFQAKFEKLGATLLAGVDAMLLAKTEVARTDIDSEYRKAVIELWIGLLEKNAKAWCSDPSVSKVPFFAERYSFDEPQWQEAAVDASGWNAWIYLDENEGKESCAGGRWVARYLSSSREVTFDLLPPSLPSPGGGLCGGWPLVASLTDAWAKWNSAWDGFEQLHRSGNWVKAHPFVWQEFTPSAGWSLRRNPESQLDLKALPGNKLVLTWRGVELLTTVISDDEVLCPTAESKGDARCDRAIEAAYYSPGSLMLRYGDDYGTLELVLPVSNPQAPVPFVYCNPRGDPAISLPNWASDNLPVSYMARKGLLVQGSPLPQLAIELPAMPDLAAVNAVLTEEKQVPPGPNKGKPQPEQSEMNRVNQVLKQPLYRDLFAALSNLGGKPLPRRFLMLDRWLAYLSSPANYKEQLIEWDRAWKLQQAEERKAEAEYQQQERERKAKETRLLGSVPGLGSKCRQAIQDWVSSSEQIKRAAVSGQPSVVKTATLRRDKAATRVCEAARTLRSAIALYQNQGLKSAAEAISREHYQCLRSCN